MDPVARTSSPRSSVDHEAKTLKNACRQFESLFLHAMMKEMRQSSHLQGLEGNGLAMQITRDMHDQALAQNLAGGGGVGLADMLYKNLQITLQDSGDSADKSGVRRTLP